MIIDTLDQLDQVVRLYIPGQPYPKQRPRSRRGQRWHYTPARTRHWENTIASHAHIYRVNHGYEMMTGDLGIVAIFERKTRRRADVDNLMKCVLDGLEGVWYENDRQVTAQFGYVSYNTDEPGVTIYIVPIAIFKRVVGI